MSADNGIYILKTKSNFQPIFNKKGEEIGAENLFGKPIFIWRVAHIQGIDNLGWYEKNEPYNVGAYLANVFKKSEKYLTEESAWNKAIEKSKEYDILEYGINFIDRSYMIFFGD